MAKNRCRYPHKDKLTKAEARGRAGALTRQNKIPINAYRCGDHWHVGHGLKRNGTNRKRKRW